MSYSSRFTTSVPENAPTLPTPEKPTDETAVADGTAVANAVAHRDYSISGSKMRLHMFSDRLEIFSPGALPNSLTVDEIGERQFSRNELICTCLSRCPLTAKFTDIVRARIMDRRGEGVPVILSASGKLSGKRPKYERLGDSELKLTIFAAPAEDKAALKRIAAGLSTGVLQTVQTFTEMETLDKIKELIRANPRITQNEMSKACGISRTAATCSRWKTWMASPLYDSG